jgi:hypothetical protein
MVLNYLITLQFSLKFHPLRYELRPNQGKEGDIFPNWLPHCSRVYDLCREFSEFTHVDWNRCNMTFCQNLIPNSFIAFQFSLFDNSSI